MKKLTLLFLSFLTSTVLAAEGPLAQVSGQVNIDGSSTVYPITEAVAEDFFIKHPDRRGKIKVNIGISGTGGGFKKAISSADILKNTKTPEERQKKGLAIIEASRAGKTSELQALQKKGLKFLELTIGYDGITVIINPKNTWAKNLTLDQLAKIWTENGKAKKWSDVVAQVPAEKDGDIKIAMPGHDSGTFDFFYGLIKKHIKKSKEKGTPVVAYDEKNPITLVKDAVTSEDDNIIVNYVAGNVNAIGFLGYAYYVSNKTKVSSVAVNGITPDNGTISQGTYAISRPLYLYLNLNQFKENKALRAFMNHYLTVVKGMVSQVNYTPASDEFYLQAKKKIGQELALINQ